MTLRLRLVLLVGVVVVASLAAVFFGSSRLVRIEIQKLEEVTRSSEAPAQPARRAIREAIAEHHAARGWADVQPLLARLQREHSPARPLLLVEARARLIGASSLPPGGVRLATRGADGLVVEYTVQGAPVRVMVFPEPVDGLGQSLPAQLFVVPEWRQQPLVVSRTIDRRLLLMIGGIGALALAATALIARTVVRPIEQLQAAVQRLSRGALGEQVTALSGDEVGALADAFNTMSAQLARDDAMRRNMVNDVAHELRTPLTRMLCAVEAVQDGLRRADAGTLTTLHDDLTLLQRLVEDLETLALAESGKLPLHLQAVDVAADVGKWVAAQPDGDRARIDLAIPRDLVIAADRIRFQQIIANLVRNALRHGGPVTRVCIAAERTSDGVQLSVSDKGPGIDAAHLPYVFDRFYRGDAARGRSTGGSGLGLAIVKHLVELHGGRVTVGNTPGAGATFRVQFGESAAGHAGAAPPRR